MKAKILELLLANGEQFLSGEEMGRQLGISRAGIAKHISKLRQEGYKIESQTRLGHRLERSQIPLNRFELSRNLATSLIGSEIVVVQEATSTNDLAKEMARKGARSGSVVVAVTQTGGRGRMGRQWVSPSGGVWLSTILRPQLALRHAAIYTLLAGVAVAVAINEVTGLKSGIKWPNDILLAGKKTGGILTEVFGEWQSIDFLVIGIGINANLSPTQLPQGVEATSLAIQADKEISLIKLIQTILYQLEQLEQKLATHGSDYILAEWRRLAVCLNCPVTVKEHNNIWLGQSVDIAPDGALLVRNTDGKLVKVYSGDVSLRDVNGGLRFK